MKHEREPGALFILSYSEALVPLNGKSVKLLDVFASFSRTHGHEITAQPQSPYYKQNMSTGFLDSFIVFYHSVPFTNKENNS